MSISIDKDQIDRNWAQPCTEELPIMYFQFRLEQSLPRRDLIWQLWRKNSPNCQKTWRKSTDWKRKMLQRSKMNSIVNWFWQLRKCQNTFFRKSSTKEMITTMEGLMRSLRQASQAAPKARTVDRPVKIPTNHHRSFHSKTIDPGMVTATRLHIFHFSNK